MVMIGPWALEQEDLEILWLAGHYHHPKLGRQIRVVTRGLSFGKIEDWRRLPIGLLPLLKLGRVVSRGEILDIAVTGTKMSARIPNLASGEDLDALECVYKPLYPFGGHRGWGQRVLRYFADGKILLIPTIELIRVLFLHNKALARAILQPAGLINLATPVEPAFHEKLQIDFTWGMPRRSLNRDIVREFAWIAADTSARKAWDSVLELSHGKHYLTFEPPPLATQIEFRGVRWKAAHLVLEITGIAGRSLPCNFLSYSHPAERSLKGHDVPVGLIRKPTRRSQVGPERPKIRDPEIDPEAGSRKDRNQRAVLAGQTLGRFTNDVPISKVRLPKLAKATGHDPLPQDSTEPTPAPPVHRHHHIRDRKRMPVSVGPEAIRGGLPPIEFTILEPADWTHVGEADWLAEVVRRIAQKYPEFLVSMSMCLIKDGRTFSMVNDQRRACLVALFRRPDHPPVILLDVDHSGITALAGLMLRYQSECPFAEIEHHIKELLNALVDRNGKWDRKTETGLPDLVSCRRLPRVLRQQGKRSTRKFLDLWTDRLVERIWGGPEQRG